MYSFVSDEVGGLRKIHQILFFSHKKVPQTSVVFEKAGKGCEKSYLSEGHSSVFILAYIRFSLVMHSAVLLERTNLCEALTAFIAIKTWCKADLPLKGPRISFVFTIVVITVLLLRKFHVSTFFEALEEHLYY